MSEKLKIGNIYFLGGNLENIEGLYGKYRLMLKRNIDSLHGDFTFWFVSERACTRARFKELWTDAKTYGIFWFGHGTPSGLPATAEPMQGEQYQTLNPMVVPMSGTNLRFLALISCYSGKWEDEWRRKLKRPTAQLATFDDTITGATAENVSAEIENWITKARFDVRPTSSAIRLIGFAIDNVSEEIGLSPKTISFDYFEPIKWFVPVIVLPREKPETNPLRHPVRKLTHPPPGHRPGTLPVQWDWQKKGGHWIIGPSGSLSPSGTGGLAKNIDLTGGAGTQGPSIVNDIHSHFRSTPSPEPIEPIGGTGARTGSFGSNQLSGQGPGIASIVNDIHSRFRPLPTHVPLGPSIPDYTIEAGPPIWVRPVSGDG